MERRHRMGTLPSREVRRRRCHRLSSSQEATGPAADCLAAWLSARCGLRWFRGSGDAMGPHVMRETHMSAALAGVGESRDRVTRTVLCDVD